MELCRCRRLPLGRARVIKQGRDCRGHKRTAPQDTGSQDTGSETDTGPVDTGAEDVKPPCSTNADCGATANPCTVNVCDPKIGCVESVKPDNALCDDGDACTAPDSCQKGVCAAGPAVQCDDKNPCTKDSCNKDTGQCANEPDTGKKCDDGDSSTVNDVCDDAGKCKGKVLGCLNDVGCADKGSGDLCQGTLFCNKDKSPPACEINPSTVIKCPTWQNTECSQNRCDPKSGKCAMEAVREYLGCDADNNPCTPHDTCASGKCVKGANICQCGLDSECDPYNDDDKCTADLYCHKPGAVPWFCEPNPAKQVNCVDGKGCTTQKCDPKTGKCAEIPWTGGKPCDDGNACTKASFCDGALCDVCVEGKCVGQPTTCTGGDACNAAACDPKTGLCGKTAKDCDDKDPCTTDSCDPKVGCKKAFNTDVCDDGKPCSVGDKCKEGKCEPGPAKVCDDKNPCTTDSCNAADGQCAHPAGNDGAKCDDGNLCTEGDACKAGNCTGAAKKCDDGNDCTSDTCATQTGKCETANVGNGTGCNADNNPCTTGDSCAAGACKAGAAKACDDSNTCTTDSCDTKTGKCVNQVIADGKPCGGGGCKVGGACKAGKCDGAVDSLSVQTLDNKGDNVLELAGLRALGNGDVVGVGRLGGSACTLSCKDDGHALLMRFDPVGKELSRASKKLVVSVKGKATERPSRLNDVLAAANGALYAIGSRHDDTNTISVPLLMRFSAKGAYLSHTDYKSELDRGFLRRQYRRADGLFIAVGGTRAGAKYHALVLAYDAALGKKWHTALDTSGANSEFYGVARLAGNHTMAVGKRHNSPLVARFDANGKAVWSRLLTNTDGLQLHWAGPAPNGHVYVGGRSGSPLGMGFGRVDASGAVVWHRQTRLGSAGSTATGGMDVDAAGNLVFSGNRTNIHLLARLTPAGEFDIFRTNVGALKGPVSMNLASTKDGGAWLSVRMKDTPEKGKASTELRRVDRWGNSTCAASGACFGKKRADCGNGLPCQSATCAAGSCNIFTPYAASAASTAQTGRPARCTSDVLPTAPATRDAHGLALCPHPLAAGLLA